MSSKPLFLDYYLTLFGLELKTLEGYDPLTEEENRVFIETGIMPIKKIKIKVNDQSRRKIS